MKYEDHLEIMRDLKNVIEISIGDAEYRAIVTKQIEDIEFKVRNLLEYEGNTVFNKLDEFIKMKQFIEDNRDIIGNRFTVQTWKGQTSQSWTINVYLKSIQVSFKTHVQKFANEIMEILSKYGEIEYD